jgi:hypothetical protein
LSRGEAGSHLLVFVALLSAAGCQPQPTTRTEQERMARAMAKVEAEQAESDRTLPARNAANNHQVLIANQLAQ